MILNDIEVWEIHFGSTAVRAAGPTSIAPVPKTAAVLLMFQSVAGELHSLEWSIFSPSAGFQAM